jgi:hypothetical protein
LDHNPEAKDGMYWIDLGGIYPKQVSFQNCMINVKVNFESNANVVSKFSTYALFVLKFAQFKRRYQLIVYKKSSKNEIHVANICRYLDFP